MKGEEIKGVGKMEKGVKKRRQRGRCNEGNKGRGRRGNCGRRKGSEGKERINADEGRKREKGRK